MEQPLCCSVRFYRLRRARNARPYGLHKFVILSDSEESPTAECKLDSRVVAGFHARGISTKKIRFVGNDLCVVPQDFAQQKLDSQL